ncbi:holo-ACP synthase [Bacterioplanoides pacificum]|uniref:Holo-[acyl-carrier-protein] synthase n=1 Tax=Bacterioplanoides pacificum TaxID=1171596 RepID=A0ABV7VWB5_9GAMM
MVEFPQAQGIIGIGTDLLDVSRIEQAYQRHGERLVRRFLTPAEQQVWQQRHQSINYLAKRYAAKEALAKALGTGIAKGVGFQQLEVLSDRQGAPRVNLYQAALLRMQQLGGRQAFISLSDEGPWIQAFAVISR